MARNIDDDLLIHYLAGECTNEERMIIESRLSEDPDLRRKLEELRRLWEEAGWSEAGVRDVDAMWQGLSRRLPDADRETRRRGVKTPSRNTGRRGVTRSPVLRTVAFGLCVAVVAFLIGLALNDRVSSPSSLTMREVVTEAGERARVNLQDGTHVMLNAKSSIRLPENFGAALRTVELEGEAYFEVSPEKDRPFLVRAGGAEIRVLGTKFGVGAYPNDAEVEVVVAEGKVAVHERGASLSDSAVLTRRQLGRITRDGSRYLTTEDVELQGYLGWTNGRLVFSNAPFSVVAAKLDRWYGLEVTLDGAVRSVDRLNASFGQEPVPEVLRVVAKSLGMRFERTDNRVRFFDDTLE